MNAIEYFKDDYADLTSRMEIDDISITDTLRRMWVYDMELFYKYYRYIENETESIQLVYAIVDCYKSDLVNQHSIGINREKSYINHLLKTNAHMTVVKAMKYYSINYKEFI